MAAVDKTYTNKEGLIEVIDWCLKVGKCKLENGYCFRPLNYVLGYNELDDNYRPIHEQDTYVVWNTPVWFDRWLWLNCPLELIKDRLLEQYGEDGVKEFEDFVYTDPNNDIRLGKQHYTFLKEPKWKAWKWFANNARRDWRWPGNCKQATLTMSITLPGDKKDWMKNELKYSPAVDRWYPDFGYMPIDHSGYIWQKYHNRIPSKKSIIRELRRWYFTPGTIVKISGIRLKIDWEILVK